MAAAGTAKRRRRRVSWADIPLPADLLPEIVNFATPHDILPLWRQLPERTRIQILANRGLPNSSFCALQYDPPSRCLRGTTLSRQIPPRAGLAVEEEKATALTRRVSCLDWC